MRTERLGRLAALAAAACVVAASAGAAELYVKAGAEGAGTKDAPFGEIWKAVDKAVRGDVIHVAAGVYNGKGGSGALVVAIPDLTLVGGYNADFTERNPFKNLTILERAKDYRGDAMGLPEGIVAGKHGEDHGGLILDGFVLNGQSRNAYKGEGDINPKDSWNGPLFQAESANIRIRNCILLNPFGEGIYASWRGGENEITNTFVLNTFYDAVSTRAAQKDAVVTIRNCTVLFSWFQAGKGGGMGVFVGGQGKTVLENNIVALCQTEGGEAGYGVSNTFGNDETVMKGNVFFQCQGGYYKYLDENKQNLLVWKPSEMKELNADGEPYMLAESGGNSEEDPKLAPDKDYFEKFSNFVASEPGKLNMDFLNQWRSSVGLPLQAEPGSARKNYGMAYPLAAVVPGLVSKLPGKGVQLEGPFAEYKAAAPAAEAKNYVEASFDEFKKGAEGVKALAGKAVSLKVGLGPAGSNWLVASAPREKYDCVKMLLPGEPDMTMKYMHGYLLKGSAAAQEWDKLAKKKDKYKDGIVVKGAVWYAGSDTYAYPAAMVIDEVAKK